MSVAYDNYIQQHKANVAKAFNWIRENLPALLEDKPDDYEWQIVFAHDESKTFADEYAAYDAYFYGGNRSFEVVKNFREAWLKHIHRNPHHWQHWVLIKDDPNEGEWIADMPHNYVIEMICDWWAFSWSKGNLKEIFSWYDEHKAYMKLSDNTRKLVESILNDIAKKLEEHKS
jgi:hypothetical protein